MRYTTSLDACDTDAVVDCFAPDGWLDSPVLGRFEGHAGVREFVGRTIKVRDERGGQFRHVISNLRVETQGDRGIARCYLLDYLTVGGNTELLSPGEYRCDAGSKGRRLEAREPRRAHGSGVPTSGLGTMTASTPSTPLGTPEPPEGDALRNMEEAGPRLVKGQQAALPPAWRSLDRVVVVTTEFVLFLVGAMFTIAVTLAVVTRYLLDFSMFWVDASARFLLVWFFLLGAGHRAAPRCARGLRAPGVAARAAQAARRAPRGVRAVAASSSSRCCGEVSTRSSRRWRRPRPVSA